MKTYELIGEVDEQHHIFISATVPPDFAPGKVRVTFTPVDSEVEELEDISTWLQNLAVDTGIEDLAHQHDHYIHGTPKRAA